MSHSIFTLRHLGVISRTFSVHLFLHSRLCSEICPHFSISWGMYFRSQWWKIFPLSNSLSFSFQNEVAKKKGTTKTKEGKRNCLLLFSSRGRNTYITKYIPLVDQTNERRQPVSLLFFPSNSFPHYFVVVQILEKRAEENPGPVNDPPFFSLRGCVQCREPPLIIANHTGEDNRSTFLSHYRSLYRYMGTASFTPVWTSTPIKLVSQSK